MSPKMSRVVTTLPVYLGRFSAMFDRIIRLRDCPIAQYSFIWYTREVGYTPSYLRNKLGTFSSVHATQRVFDNNAKYQSVSPCALFRSRKVMLPVEACRHEFDTWMYVFDINTFGTYRYIIARVPSHSPISYFTTGMWGCDSSCVAHDSGSQSIASAVMRCTFPILRTAP